MATTDNHVTIRAFRCPRCGIGTRLDDMISTSDPDGVAIECPECGLRTFDTPSNPCIYDHVEPSDDGELTVQVPVELIDLLLTGYTHATAHADRDAVLDDADDAADTLRELAASAMLRQHQASGQ